jgi:hypothetical protein
VVAPEAQKPSRPTICGPGVPSSTVIRGATGCGRTLPGSPS